MKAKSSATVLSVLILGALLFGLGCGLIEGVLERFADESVQGVVGKLTEEGLPEAVELPLEGLPEGIVLNPDVLPGGFELPEGFGLAEGFEPGETVSWPEWAPAFLPVYEYGELIVAYDLPDQAGGSLIYANLQTDRDPFAAYVADLERNGWVEEEGWSFPEEEGQAIAMTRGGYWLQYALVIDGDEAAATLTLFAEAD